MQDSYGGNNPSFFVYRTELFDRCLSKMQKKGGTAAMAAKKADEFIDSLMNCDSNHERKKFSYTWNGECRIKNCRKIDLIGAYRLVLIHKDNHCVLLYVGSHDDCFRWIERNKGITYEIKHSTGFVELSRQLLHKDDDLPPDVLEHRQYINEYEDKLMQELDDNMLLKIFHGWSKESEGFRKK